MKGWIFGKENDAEWTQKIYKQSRKCMNPLRQNYKHTRVLAETLGIPREKCKSVVVFIGDSKFKTQMPENVTQASGYIRFIRSHTRPVLTNDEVGEIVRTIKEERLSPGFKTHAEHIRHVKDIKAQKKLTARDS